MAPSEINLKPTISNERDNGNWLPLHSSVTRSDGSTATITDVYFRTISSAEGDIKSINSPSALASYVRLGTSGDDVLLGMSSDQIFLGGAGSDVFKFNHSSGHDRIIDFERGVDRPDISDWALSDLDGLVVTQTNEGMMLSDGVPNSVLLHRNMGHSNR